VVRTNFSADFWTYRNVLGQFRENYGATWWRKWEPFSASDSAIPSEKNRWKWHQNRPIDHHTILVWTMSPTRRQTKRDKQKTPVFAPTVGARSSISPKLCMLIENVVTILKGGNHFSIQRIAFSYRGENADFSVTDALSKFNTVRLPWQPAGKNTGQISDSSWNFRCLPSCPRVHLSEVPRVSGQVDARTTTNQILNHTSHSKTGQSGSKPDTWQP